MHLLREYKHELSRPHVISVTPAVPAAGYINIHPKLGS